MMKRLMIICVCCMAVCCGNMAFAQETTSEPLMVDGHIVVRARIGIELVTDKETVSARVRERVRAGDRYRVYAVPEPDPAYLYVVYADRENAALLNDPKDIKVTENTPLIVPSMDELYLFDDSSPKVTMTVICSADELPELEPLLTVEDYSLEQWQEVEQKLIEQSKIELGKIPDKPWPMAGAVRGEGILQKLTITSGKSLVVKRYVFEVKK